MIHTYTSKEDFLSLPKGKIKTVILAGNGIFEYQESWLGQSLSCANPYECVVYPDLQEFLVLKEQEEKIPEQAILAIMNWYSDISDKTGKEAQINFYKTGGKRFLSYKEEEIPLSKIPGVVFWSDTLFSYTPKQKNSFAMTTAEDEVYDELNKQFGIFVETHSHNKMDAFASGTDLSYSQNDGIQLVFGKFEKGKNQAVMHTWATIRGVTREFLSEEELSCFMEIPKTLKKMENGKYIISQFFNTLSKKKKEKWNKQILKETFSSSSFKPQKYFPSKYDKYFPTYKYEKDFQYTEEDICTLAEEQVLSEVCPETLDDTVAFTYSDLIDIYFRGVRAGRKKRNQVEDIVTDCFVTIPLLTEEF